MFTLKPNINFIFFFFLLAANKALSVPISIAHLPRQEPIEIAGTQQLKIVDNNQVLEFELEGRTIKLYLYNNEYQIPEGVTYEFEAIVGWRGILRVFSIKPTMQITEPMFNKSTFNPKSLKFGQRVKLRGEFIITI